MNKAREEAPGLLNVLKGKPEVAAVRLAKYFVKTKLPSSVWVRGNPLAKGHRLSK